MLSARGREDGRVVSELGDPAAGQRGVPLNQQPSNEGAAVGTCLPECEHLRTGCSARWGYAGVGAR